MSAIQERYSPIVLGANGTAPITGSAVGGFLCTATGTITITRTVGGDLITAMPVTAGVYYPIPFYIGATGGTVTLATNAAGVLGVG